MLIAAVVNTTMKHYAQNNYHTHDTYLLFIYFYLLTLYSTSAEGL